MVKTADDAQKPVDFEETTWQQAAGIDEPTDAQLEEQAKLNDIYNKYGDMKLADTSGAVHYDYGKDPDNIKGRYPLMKSLYYDFLDKIPGAVSPTGEKKPFLPFIYSLGSGKMSDSDLKTLQNSLPKRAFDLLNHYSKLLYNSGSYTYKAMMAGENIPYQATFVNDVLKKRAPEGFYAPYAAADSLWTARFDASHGYARNRLLSPDALMYSTYVQNKYKDPDLWGDELEHDPLEYSISMNMRDAEEAASKNVDFRIIGNKLYWRKGANPTNLQYSRAYYANHAPKTSMTAMSRGPHKGGLNGYKAISSMFGNEGYDTGGILPGTERHSYDLMTGAYANEGNPLQVKDIDRVDSIPHQLPSVLSDWYSRYDNGVMERFRKGEFKPSKDAIERYRERVYTTQSDEEISNELEQQRLAWELHSPLLSNGKLVNPVNLVPVLEAMTGGNPDPKEQANTLKNFYGDTMFLSGRDAPELWRSRALSAISALAGSGIATAMHIPGGVSSAILADFGLDAFINGTETGKRIGDRVADPSVAEGTGYPETSEGQQNMYGNGTYRRFQGSQNFPVVAEPYGIQGEVDSGLGGEQPLASDFKFSPESVRKMYVDGRENLSNILADPEGAADGIRMDMLRNIENAPTLVKGVIDRFEKFKVSPACSKEALERLRNAHSVVDAKTGKRECLYDFEECIGMMFAQDSFDRASGMSGIDIYSDNWLTEAVKRVSKNISGIPAQLTKEQADGLLVGQVYKLLEMRNNAICDAFLVSDGKRDARSMTDFVDKRAPGALENMITAVLLKHAHRNPNLTAFTREQVLERAPVRYTDAKGPSWGIAGGVPVKENTISNEEADKIAEDNIKQFSWDTEMLWNLRTVLTESIKDAVTRGKSYSSPMSDRLEGFVGIDPRKVSEKYRKLLNSRQDRSGDGWRIVNAVDAVFHRWNIEKMLVGFISGDMTGLGSFSGKLLDEMVDKAYYSDKDAEIYEDESGDDGDATASGPDGTAYNGPGCGSVATLLMMYGNGNGSKACSMLNAGEQTALFNACRSAIAGLKRVVSRISRPGNPVSDEYYDVSNVGDFIDGQSIQS